MSRHSLENWAIKVVARQVGISNTRNNLQKMKRKSEREITRAFALPCRPNYVPLRTSANRALEEENAWSPKAFLTRAEPSAIVIVWTKRKVITWFLVDGTGMRVLSLAKVSGLVSRALSKLREKFAHRLALRVNSSATKWYKLLCAGRRPVR